jgi:molecular chaperone IbpA
MATLDFTPLYRTTVGFDRVPTMLSHALQREESTYPPYNIEKCGDDEYRIVLAVAGFSQDDIEVVCEQNTLVVRGHMKQKNGRDFERVFDLADYIEVTGAVMGDGLLVIDLKRELPEAMKPRRIEIGAAPLKHIAHGKLDKAAA